jgi:hypothetical protein
MAEIRTRRRRYLRERIDKLVADLEAGRAATQADIDSMWQVET